MGALVRLDGVEKSFGGTPVLRSVSLSVEEGQVVGLIGRSGSGKSTLLRCINALEVPEHGRVYVDGLEVDPRKTDLRVLRRKVGMVFQSFNLFPHLTAARNVMLAPMKVDRLSLRAAEVLAREQLGWVGLESKMDAYPHELSGGQRQRVAIARALAMRPRVMLFDEPTSALDPELVGEVLRVMERLANDGMTMIVVTHELGFARGACSHIAFMHDGRIAEIQTPEDLFARPRTAEARQFLAAMV